MLCGRTFCYVCYVSNRKLRTAQYAINIFVRWKKPKSLWFYSEEKWFFHKSNYINQKGIKIHVLEDKALCPKLTFWERCVCLYDQALLCYCVHSKAHAWLIDTILDVSARVVFSSWLVIGWFIDIPLSCPYLEVEYLSPNHVYTWSVCLI